MTSNGADATLRKSSRVATDLWWRKCTEKILRINERVRAAQVRLIDADGKTQLGIVPSRQALEIAKAKGLDLIEIAPNAQPPVCRIMDYGKFRYEQRKREKEAHKKSAAAELKAIRIHPDTQTHDMERFTRDAERFVLEGHKVRITCMFRGREMTHPELGRERLERIAENLKEFAHIEQRPSMQGRQMHMIISPNPGVVKKAQELRQKAKAAQTAEAAAENK